MQNVKEFEKKMCDLIKEYFGADAKWNFSIKQGGDELIFSTEPLEEENN